MISILASLIFVTGLLTLGYIAGSAALIVFFWVANRLLDLYVTLKEKRQYVLALSESTRLPEDAQ